jgi:hyperosmotically inducible periplasmic protein
MKVTKVLVAAILVAAIGFTSCKPKDADIAKTLTEKIATMPDLAGTKVEVKDGVVTLSGECKDDACKANCEKAISGLAVKGVKSVVNNCTVKPVEVIPTSIDVAGNAANTKLQNDVKSILKDIPGVILKGFTAKGAILEGAISAANNMKLKQAMMAAKVMLDPASKITVK